MSRFGARAALCDRLAAAPLLFAGAMLLLLIGLTNGRHAMIQVVKQDERPESYHGAVDLIRDDAPSLGEDRLTG